MKLALCSKSTQKFVDPNYGAGDEVLEKWAKDNMAMEDNPQNNQLDAQNDPQDI